jgi:hypothetical protein
VLRSVHRQLLSIDHVDPSAAFRVVLTRVAVLVLSSALRAWFHARVFSFMPGVRKLRFY